MNSFWRNMFCPLNPMYETESDFILDKNEPPIIHNPENLKVSYYQQLPKKYVNILTTFMAENDCTITGNTTEITPDLIQRYNLSKSLYVLMHEEMSSDRLVGVIIGLNMPVFHEVLFSGAYATFLCVHRNYRQHGYARILIQHLSYYAYLLYHNVFGYYITTEKHHTVNTEVLSWYRPINIDKLKSAKYTLQPHEHQKLWYVVPPCQETVITASASAGDYERVSFLLKKGEIYLNLKKKDYLKLLEMFDIFLIGDVVLLMIPMNATVNGILIRQYHLALMIGNKDGRSSLDKAIYLASQQRYDVVTGWCCGDVTEADVRQEKGLITVVKAYLECYNSSKMIAPADWFLPIF